MLGFDPFEEAKKHSLSSYLSARMGEQPVGSQQGKSMRMRACPHCGPGSGKNAPKLKITFDRYYHCYSCGRNGSIVDACMALDGYAKALDAAKDVCQGSTALVAWDLEKIRRVNEQEARKNDARARITAALFEASRDSFDSDVRDWLTNTRHISRSVVNDAWKRGLIGTIPSKRHGGHEFLVRAVGIDLLREAGLWNDERESSFLNQMPFVQFMPGRRCAELRRIWMPPPKEGVDPPMKTFTLGVKSEQQGPYFWQGQDGRCLVTEGMLDLLAAATMGCKWHIIGTPGVSSVDINWFHALAKAGKAKTFDLAFDNDVGRVDGKNPGQDAQKLLAKALSENNLACTNASPQSGDLNDALIAQRRAAATAKVKQPIN